MACATKATSMLWESESGLVISGSHLCCYRECHVAFVSYPINLFKYDTPVQVPVLVQEYMRRTFPYILLIQTPNVYFNPDEDRTHQKGAIRISTFVTPQGISSIPMPSSCTQSSGSRLTHIPQIFSDRNSPYSWAIIFRSPIMDDHGISG